MFKQVGHDITSNLFLFNKFYLKKNYLIKANIELNPLKLEFYSKSLLLLSNTVYTA